MPMVVTLLLADAAQAVDNKLYILGGGWSIIDGLSPVPSAIAVHIKVPWDEANRRHTLRLELVDSDGAPVMVDGLDGSEPVTIETPFEVGRPPGLFPGTPIDLSFAVNVGPLPMPPGRRFEWRLTIDGSAEPDWHAAFSTRPSPGGPAR